LTFNPSIKEGETMARALKPVEKVEILTLQDNYIEMTAADNSAVITRAAPLKEGEIRASIIAEHGFSAVVKAYVGDKAHTLLFDFGFSEEGAAQNARTLGVDMGEVEAACLSHGHGDHTGGMRALGKMMGRKETPLVLHPAVFKSPRYLKMGPNLRINFPVLPREMVREASFSPIEATEPFFMCEDTMLFLGEIPRRTDFERGFPIAYWQDKGEEKWDAIEDDSSVVLNLKDRGLIIISGCAHAGIINTALYARETTGVENIHAILGGFHLSGPLFEAIIDRTTAELTKLNPDYIVPMHCTGRKAIMAIERAMPDKFLLNMAGTKISFV